MSAKFLNERLVTTRRFGPAEDSDRVPETTSASKKANAPKSIDGELDSLLQREATETRKAIQQETLSELLRHRKELVNQLAVAMTTMATEQGQLAEQIDILAEVHGLLQQASSQPDTDPAAPSVKQLRQLVRTAHMELLGCEKKRILESSENPVILSLTFSQLTRLGIGLTWPLLLGLLLAATIVAVAIFAVFAVRPDSYGELPGDFRLKKQAIRKATAGRTASTGTLPGRTDVAALQYQKSS